MKKYILILVVALFVSTSIQAQMYDGITQPTRFRIWLPVTTNLGEAPNATVAPFVGYKQNVCNWFNLTGVLQYNINKQSVIPQIWLNFNVKEKFYILSRSIYDIKDKKYKHTLSATYKLPKGFMIDATWDNIYDGNKFCDTDRLQFVAGYGYKWFVINAGYSCRNKAGFVTNMRFKITEYNWLQLKYDGGTNSLQVSTALQFN